MAKIVVLGGGFAGVNAAKILACKLNKNEHAVSLISKQKDFVFSPLLHEVASGAITESNITEPIDKIISSKNFEFAHTEISKIDFEDKKIHTTAGEISFDYLLIALGSRANMKLVEGLTDKSKVHTIKTLEDSGLIRVRMNELAAKYVESKSEKKEIRIIFAGCGATGIEMACEVSDFFRDYFKRFGDMEAHKHIKMQMLEKSDKILPFYDECLRKHTLEVLNEKGIEVLYNSKLKDCEASKAIVEKDGALQKMPVSMLFVTTGVLPCDTHIKGGHECKNEHGFFTVDEYLQVKGLENVWAAGDVAYFVNPGEEKPVPMLAQSAKAEGKAAAENIIAKINGKSQKAFSFKMKGFLLSLGCARGVGTINGKLYSGKKVWLLKRSIYALEFFRCVKKIKNLYRFSLKGLFKKSL